MHRKQFQDILTRYLRGQATPEEERLIDSWYARIRKETDFSLHEVEFAALEKKYWSRINARIKQERRGATYRRIQRAYAVGIAASVLLALSSILYMGDYFPAGSRLMTNNDQSNLKWKCISNHSHHPEVVILPDESRVTLQSKSRIRYSVSFDDKERSVYLEGEGFFEVTRDEEKPFYVRTGTVTTKVLGTSFIVKAFQKERDVTVAVKTGTVSVYTNGDETHDGAIKENEVILTPNQKIIYDKTGKKLSRMIVESPQAILPHEEMKRMRFEAAPVTEIFMAIEKVYGVDLVYDAEKFSGCHLTSVISDGDIYNRLNIICNTIGATYSVKENHIVISGAGCNNP